jgi:hypothetical protein
MTNIKMKKNRGARLDSIWVYEWLIKIIRKQDPRVSKATRLEKSYELGATSARH